MFNYFSVPFSGTATSHLSLKPILFMSLLTISSFSVADVNNLTLSSAIKRTLDQHPALKVFKFRQTALEGQQQTQALNPVYHISFGTDNFAGTGGLKAFNSAQFTISLSSVIEMGGKRHARINVANHLTMSHGIQT